MKCKKCNQDNVIYVNVLGQKQKYCQGCGFMYYEKKETNVVNHTREALASLVAGGYRIDEAWQVVVKVYLIRYLIKKKQIPNILENIENNLEIGNDVYSELDKAFQEMHNGSKRIPNYDIRQTKLPEKLKPIDNFYLIPALNSMFHIPAVSVRELGLIYENNIDYMDKVRHNETATNPR